MNTISTFDHLDIALQHLKQGNMILLSDESSREDEGDFVVAAEYITSAHINFMMTHGKGLICLALEQKITEKLDLYVIPKRNANSISCNFTCSIDAVSGITTGSSSCDRAKTILDAIQPNASAKDFVVPGHVFPIQAHPKGIRHRAGHTEASVELMQLIGLQGAAVICEIVAPDGTMAKQPYLIELSKKFNMPHISTTQILSHLTE